MIIFLFILDNHSDIFIDICKLMQLLLLKIKEAISEINYVLSHLFNQSSLLESYKLSLSPEKCPVVISFEILHERSAQHILN